MSARILVVRGGAIGDFILTLPALALLRENFPNARLEILGYKHIVALAEARFYADATRSIEYGPMAGFFDPRSELASDLVQYFASFQQIISFLYDPNGYFEANLRRAGARNIISAYAPVEDGEHVSHQLARPLQQLALYLDEPRARFYPNAADLAFAQEFLSTWEAGTSGPWLAVHPGSGSPRKNWPVDRWQQTIERILETFPRARVLLVGGEADRTQIQMLEANLASLFSPDPAIARVRVACDLSLPSLGAILGRARLFLGHDSGISHLAAAAGARCVLLFGPTDPAVWAPVGPDVRVIEAPGRDLHGIPVDAVAAAAGEVLSQ